MGVGVSRDIGCGVLDSDVLVSVAYRFTAQFPIDSPVICERLVELESDGARHHLGLRWG